MADIKSPPITYNGTLDDVLTPSFFSDNRRNFSQGTVGNGIYDLEYYNAQQVQLYIGDVLVDEITDLQISTSQSKKPVYGYASQMFDGVSHGTFIVQGSFSINFKESGYLWLILHRYKRFQNTTDDILAKYSGTGNERADAVTTVRNKGFTGTKVLGGKNIPFVRIKDKQKERDFISRASIERIVKNEATKDERFEFYQNLAGYATVNNPGALDTAFEDIVEAFEDQVWQEDISDVDNDTRRVDDNFFDDFDMFVVFGDYTKPGSNHTVRRIRNVHLVGQAQQIGLSDGTIVENYQFFARNLL
jgi:hypothetical protein